jgi:hypothetical protein
MRVNMENKIFYSDVLVGKIGGRLTFGPIQYPNVKQLIDRGDM